MMTEESKQDILDRYAPGKTVTLGNWNGEPIQWRVLAQQGKMRLLLAEQIIAEQPYNEQYVDTYWRESSLRRWLNGVFLREAFTLTERTMILNTRVANPPNPQYRTNGGMGSVDKLFALSLEEAEDYLPHEADRALGKWWWLRSPGSNLLSAASVDKAGMIYSSGINIHYKEGGVRPAAWVLLKV